VDCFSLIDDATEPSLKARLVGLIKGAGLDRIYKLVSEREFEGGKKRVDYFMEPRTSDRRHIMLEVKSVPIYWLDSKQFGQEFWSLSSKTVVASKLTQTAEDLMQLKMNQNMQDKWKDKFLTVGEYIVHGRKQLKDYLKLAKKELGREPRGYLVWSVGMVGITVEEHFLQDS